jgi:beta-lactam-binding protein with PASTA domain
VRSIGCVVAVLAFAVVGCGSDQARTSMVRTPRLVGLSSEAAKVRIFRAGLCLGPSRHRWTNGPDGVVISQAPASGTLQHVNERVAFVTGISGPGAEIITEADWPKRCRDY